MADNQPTEDRRTACFSHPGCDGTDAGHEAQAAEAMRAEAEAESESE